MTGSLQSAWSTCLYRREKQIEFNEKYGITPKSVQRPVQESLLREKEKEDPLMVSEEIDGKSLVQLIKNLESEMMAAVKKLQFEKAALLRDQISFLKGEGEGKVHSTEIGGRNRKGKRKQKSKPYGKKK